MVIVIVNGIVVFRLGSSPFSAALFSFVFVIIEMSGWGLDGPFAFGEVIGAGSIVFQSLFYRAYINLVIDVDCFAYGIGFKLSLRVL